MIIKYYYILLLLVILISCTLSLNIKPQNKLNKPKVNLKSDQLNVHIVAHTHDDVGWLKTVDEYYYGANMSIQFAGVQYTLDSAITSLLENPERKFIYVEIAFFERWWNEQTSYTQQLVQQLVASGQLEFINGGWCMNDEATTYYDDIIDQMTLGHQFLYNNFGIMPSIGWHIDPFGHSSTMASLFGNMGYDAFIIGRMDYQDIGERLINKEMEFMWRSSESTPQYQIFTSVLRAMYCTPSGFDFEQGDPPIQDDPTLFDYNVYERAEAFVQVALEYATHFRTNNVLIPFGCDFAYMNANMYFKNIDKLIEHINANSSYGINLLYSTPSIYIDAVNRAGLTWEVKTDDLFPYADDQYSYWTGYFTSRPALKGYVRQNNALLHVMEQLLVTSNSQSMVQDIMVMRQAMGVLQHHDAVSGTEQQHVADDYAERLSIGNTATLQTMNQLVGQLLQKGKTAAPEFTFCPLLNESICPSTNPLSSGSSVPVVIYNSLSWTRYEQVKIPIPLVNVQVTNSSGQVIPSQILSYSSNTSILVFYVMVPPLGYSSFVIAPASNDDEDATKLENKYYSKPVKQDLIVLENSKVIALFDQLGNIMSITNKTSGQYINVTQEYLYYLPSFGTDETTQCSGAYIFLPIGTTAYQYNNNTPGITVSQGPIVQTLTRYWSDTMIQTYLLYVDSDHLETEEVVGPIDISDGIGKEVISRFTTSLQTDQTWYSDSNGMEMQKRVINYRPSWNLTVVQPVSGNYVPVNNIAFIQDVNQQVQFTVLTDRSRGCASLDNGEIEFMLHRRTLYDDQRGVGEPMNESTQIITTTKLIFHDISTRAQSHYRPQAQSISNPLYPMFTTTSMSSTLWPQQYSSSYSPLTGDLPEGLKIQTLQWVDSTMDAVLLRIQNIYQLDGQDTEDPQTVQIDLSQLFNSLKISSVTEMNLTGVMKYSNINRLQWNTTTPLPTSKLSKVFREKEDSQSSFVYEISPMDIRTFMVTF
ncbi:alpha-mannosidase [Tieghemostelium lacteum]|uniref:Alpha-mannosidase n=1 Tax=Tieghemostelium lacteum TaxID=361077 RepID=A0A151ZIT8_TIELA|nr:alpha-mannosidase [Tieghemostelium lacteum]|eukprot:KYQ93883.1 alpha-mannosidase [Tieghemostelium lacteum]